MSRETGSDGYHEEFFQEKVVTHSNSEEESDPVITRNVTVSSGDGILETKDDFITVEEPMQIVLESGGSRKNYAVIMRTPGMDIDLTAGFLFSEGIVGNRSDILSIHHDSTRKVDTRNVVVAEISNSTGINGQIRELAVNSSCGVCGKSSINEVFLTGSKPLKIRSKLRRAVILRLPGALRENQEVFSRTGGIHAAGLFDYDGNILMAAEDVGRHNAVDKIIGHMFLNDMLNGKDYALQVSGRAGFEIVQKAARGGISVVSSVSAPSSLAVETADTFNVTLVSFVRNNRFNVYTHGERFEPA